MPRGTRGNATFRERAPGWAFGGAVVFLVLTGGTLLVTVLFENRAPLVLIGPTVLWAVLTVTFGLNYRQWRRQRASSGHE